MACFKNQELYTTIAKSTADYHLISILRTLHLLHCSTGARAMGLIVGTGIGGLLVAPAINYPDVFSPIGLFARCGRAEP